VLFLIYVNDPHNDITSYNPRLFVDIFKGPSEETSGQNREKLTFPPLSVWTYHKFIKISGLLLQKGADVPI